MVIRKRVCVRIGIAGWSVPTALRRVESSGKTLLEQYAEIYGAVEINTSFYRPHRLATYQRWGASVPDEFRFAVKIPKQITHEHRLEDCRREIEAFTGAARGLGDKLEVLLVQLPPSLAFENAIARNFFRTLTQETGARIACEARNASWYTEVADRLFSEFDLVRVNADPQPAGCPVCEPQQANFAYVRLHGSPQIYHSSYSAACLDRLARTIAARPPSLETWCIFDNTASGAAWSNAAALCGLLSATRCADRPRARRQTN